MLAENLSLLFDRDLDKLIQEINLYPDDASLWKIAPGIANPGGNLCLHLAGNLEYFFGAVLGNTGYVRNRDAEFSTRDLTRDELAAKITWAKDMIPGVLQKLTDADMQAIYPVRVLDKEWPTGLFLMHLLAHLNYHLGQVNYHRRMS